MANKKPPIYFKVLGVDINGFTGVSDFVSDAVNLVGFNSDWVAYCYSTHTAGSPTVTVECSGDKVNWFTYLTTLDTILPNSFVDDGFYPLFMRLSYTANSSNGNVTFQLSKA